METIDPKRYRRLDLRCRRRRSPDPTSYDAIRLALDYPCSVCGAWAGVWCINRRGAAVCLGKARARLHAERLA